LFLEKKNLTFPGVSVVSGVILNFTTATFGGADNKVWIAAIIAVLFGGFIVYLGLKDKENKESGPSQFFVGLVNTLLLWITTYGVASVPAVAAASGTGG
jgi:hypothetical protein